MTGVTSRLRAAVHERLARFLEWIDAQMTIVEPDVLRPENVARTQERLDREVPRLVGKIVAREGADVSQASADAVRAIRASLAALDADIGRLDAELEQSIAADVASLFREPDAERSERITRVLSLLEREARSLRALAGQEERDVVSLMQRAELAIRRNENEVAKEALAAHGECLALAGRHLADAEQLEWLVARYRGALVAAEAARAEPPVAR